ncbi:ribokinase [Pelagimonas varians]|uniref:Ribokinase n=1 Tax=Pelagimonas varians TaxID=696760 RepID=A0A238L3K0_9RHOB|nr:ribokinase [Pelagimonas varians]PYG26563.1 ribokinase [Pelagimonas varians]SMX49391.1 Ribokinase [Pelagimonas varians]
MTIFNLGSINVDLVYRVPHLPGPGETIASTSFKKGLGGKGANMSVAIARAGSRCTHIGSVGDDGQWTVDTLASAGVDTRHIHRSLPTGHAVIYVDDAGENSIVLNAGANSCVSSDVVAAALAEAKDTDTFICQNETNLQAEAAQMAHAKGLSVAYAAAPFSAEAVKAVLPYLGLLVLNEVEAEQLQTETGHPISELPVRDIVVTLGAAGCRWYRGGQRRDFAAIPVTPVDTTGAGDTFTGYLIAALDQGKPMEAAIALAGKAGALMVTRLGTAEVIPTLQEVTEAF